MTFIQALQTLKQKLSELDGDLEMDEIALHAIFEDIVLEQAADKLDEEAIDQLSSYDSWADIEQLLQKKVADYPALLELAIAQALSEYQEDSLDS
jgi:hypothetical protein